MRLNIVSWNIRHLRWEKVEAHLKSILTQVDAGHIMFFYENKASNNMGREFVDAIGDGLQGSGGTGSKRLSWRGYRYAVGTNEFVWVIYSDACQTGAKSQYGPGQDFSISMEAQHQYDHLLETEGWKALRSSNNLTVLSSLSVGQGDFRFPAVLHFTLTKPDGSTKLLRIAAWHAPGPAMGSSGLLNYVFQLHLADKVDLFLGDFNMTGLAERQVSLPLTLHRTNASTTITKAGPVAHEEGLDLVYRNAATLGDMAGGQTVSGGLIGRTSVQVVPKPDSMTYEKAFELSDHRPVLVTVKGL